MREVIQCLIDWLDSAPSDDKPHRILRVLAEQSIKVAHHEEDIRGFTAKNIVEAANENPSESNNKWISWTRSVLPYWKIREPKIIDFARQQRLEFYPKPERISTKGGRGKETIYLIRAVPLPEISDEDQPTQLQLDSVKNQTSIHYEIAENGEVKPAWGAHWLLHDGQIRLSGRHIWAIIIGLLMLGGGAVAISYISWILLTVPKPVTSRDLTTVISVFVFPYAVWIFFIKPWLRLFEDRIVPASELLVAAIEKPAQLELFRDGDLRLIRLVRYSAHCPICGATIYLGDGSPDYPRRLVGRCYDSPREHIFSFDRVTQRGSVLRSPIV